MWTVQPKVGVEVRMTPRGKTIGSVSHVQVVRSGLERGWVPRKIASQSATYKKQCMMNVQVLALLAEAPTKRVGM